MADRIRAGSSGLDAATAVSAQSVTMDSLSAEWHGRMLRPGTMLGDRYRIVALLGEGGMGSVYKAEDLKLERVVAIKTIRPELANDQAAMQRFKQELILAREISHHNVVRLFDLGEADGLAFISMEFVDGRDLGTILRDQGKVPPAEAVEIIAQVCAGLQAAHAQGIIHRDLKPGNIMRDQTGRIVVMDFGLARTVAGEGMTRTGALVGTLDYMSPEQSKGSAMDARSDLFTVGLIFYELLTGLRPYEAESAVASLLKRSQERAQPPATRDASIPAVVSSICSKCLETDAARRYQSAADVLNELNSWKNPSSRRRPLPWWAGASAAAAVIGVAIVGFLFLRPKPVAPTEHPPISVLVADFTNNTGDSVFNGTLESMFNVAMEGAAFINTFDRAQARKLALKLPKPAETLTEEPARLVAVSQGVSTVITGELNRQGQNYIISASAVDPASGRVLAKAEITAADKDEVLQGIPKIAAPMRKALGDTTPESAQFEAVAGGFTAASLEAVHLNAIGVDQQIAGKFEEAFQSFSKAVELDPKFARAYSGMAAMAQNLGRTQDAEKYMKLAMENVDRMTERERYRNRGLFYLTAGNAQKCVEEYGQLVSRYPADRVGQNNLASCYTQLRNAGKALEAARRAVEIVPKGVGQRLNLSFIFTFSGDFVGGEREARSALDINPAAQQGYLALAEAQLGQGQLAPAEQSYRKLASMGALGASLAAGGLADVAAYGGRFADSIRTFEQGAAADSAAKMNDNAARKYAGIAYVQLLKRQNAAAITAANKALASGQSIQVRFLAARILAEAGEPDKAKKLGAGLSSELSEEPQSYGKIIEGMISLKRGDARQAIRSFTDANKLLDTWIGRFELGRAYLQAGAFTEADAEFDRCLKRRGEAMELFMDNQPTYAEFPIVYYYAARVREGLKSAGYKDFYRSYVELRGAAKEDPLLPEIRRRLEQ